MSILPAGAGAVSTAAAAASSRSSMTSDDWLRLIVEELRSQNPLNPMDPKDMMQQFAALEQTQRMVQMQQDFEKFTAISMLDAGPVLLGRTVTYGDALGLEHTAQVKAARLQNGTLTLMLSDGEAIAPAAVREVR